MLMLMIQAIEEDDDKTFMIDLYKNYYGLVHKTIYELVRDYKDLEDLINDTFIKLIKKISLIRTFDKFRITAYIVYTSRSIAINFIKHREVQKKYTYFGLDLDMAQNITDISDTMEERIVYQNEIDSLSNAILKLPQKQKDLLYFKYVLEKSDQEIAQNFGIAPDSVRQYLTRARREAKKLMEREMSNHA